MIKDFSHQSYRPKIRIKKDYRRKNFTNPYFDRTHKPEPTKGFNTKLYLKIILAVFLIYVVIYSDLFKIQAVEISGADLINQAELEQIVNDELRTWRWLMLPQSNLLLFSKGRIREAISRQYGLDDIKIKRGWQKITIQIKERVNFLIVQKNDGELFFADQDGLIIRAVPAMEIEKYVQEFPLLKTGQELNIGDQAVSPEMVSFILKLDEKIKSSGLAVNSYRSGGPTEISLITQTGWQAHFDINNDLDVSLENMQMVLNDKVPNQSQLEYIDLRFGDKIYYK